jgi:hypothetical protein
VTLLVHVGITEADTTVVRSTAHAHCQTTVPTLRQVNLDCFGCGNIPPKAALPCTCLIDPLTRNFTRIALVAFRPLRSSRSRWALLTRRSLFTRWALLTRRSLFTRNRSSPIRATRIAYRLMITTSFSFVVECS